MRSSLMLVSLSLIAVPLPAQGSRPPHIVLFLADDLGWKDVGFHGSEIRTPNIDRLAREGTRLEQFYVMPVCSPTRVCLMTGRHPIRTGTQVGVIRPWARYGLPLEERLLPEALKEAGYVTAICGKWHLGLHERAYLPTSRGFDHQYGHYTGAIDYFKHQRGRGDRGKDWNRDDRPIQEKGYSTTLIGKEAARLVRQHDAEKPLFLYVPFNAPHTPLQVPEPYLEPYEGIQNRRRRRFAAMVSCMDEAIGKVLDALKDKGMREDTLVLFASDNGGPTRGNGAGDNRPLRGGKGSYYEGGIRVPALASWPGKLEAGARVEAPIHVVDLFPTLLSVAGVSGESELPLDGKNVWETIAKGKPSPRKEFLINSTPTRGAIRVGDWKLIRRKPRRSPEYRYELYDLARDPAEKENLAEQEPEKRKQLLERLEAYARQAVKAKGGRGRRPAGVETPAYWGHPEKKEEEEKEKQKKRKP